MNSSWWNEDWLREMWVEKRTSVEVLAGICGCKVKAIYYALNQLNITRPRCALNDRIAEDLRQLYCDDGMSSTEIAARYGVHPVTIRQWMERAGIPRDQGRREPICADTLHRLYWDEGLSLKQIASRYSASSGQVHRWMEQYDIPRRPAPGAGSMSYQDYDWVYERYVNRRMLVREIAVEAGCSHSTIQTWMKKLGIECRTPHERTLRKGFGTHDRITDGYLPMGNAALQEELRGARDAMAQWKMLEVYFPVWDRALMSAQTRPGVDWEDEVALRSMRSDLEQLRKALGWQDKERLYREDGHLMRKNVSSK